MHSIELVHSDRIELSIACQSLFIVWDLVNSTCFIYRGKHERSAKLLTYETIFQLGISKLHNLAWSLLMTEEVVFSILQVLVFVVKRAKTSTPSFLTLATKRIDLCADI